MVVKFGPDRPLLLGLDVMIPLDMEVNPCKVSLFASNSVLLLFMFRLAFLLLQIPPP